MRGALLWVTCLGVRTPTADRQYNLDIKNPSAAEVLEHLPP